MWKLFMFGFIFGLLQGIGSWMNQRLMEEMRAVQPIA